MRRSTLGREGAGWLVSAVLGLWACGVSDMVPSSVSVDAAQEAAAGALGHAGGVRSYGENGGSYDGSAGQAGGNHAVWSVDEASAGFGAAAANGNGNGNGGGSGGQLAGTEGGHGTAEAAGAAGAGGVADWGGSPAAGGISLLGVGGDGASLNTDNSAGSADASLTGDSSAEPADASLTGDSTAEPADASMSEDDGAGAADDAANADGGVDLTDTSAGVGGDVEQDSGPDAPAGSALVLHTRPALLTSVDAEQGYTCGITLERRLQCWGPAVPGVTPGRSWSLEIPGLADVVAVAGGWKHACALLGNGTVRCWGANRYGQLGDDSSSDSSVPVEVVGIQHAVGLTSNGHHSCALINDGTIGCWGDNRHGQIGDGTTNNTLVPRKVVGVIHAVAASAGDHHTCALLGDGTVQCWGTNRSGQLGDSTTTNRSTPVQARGITNATAVSAGRNHTCVVLSSGAVHCAGQGSPSVFYGNSFVSVDGISNAADVSAGAFHTCATLSDRTVRCWGANSVAQLGDGTTPGLGYSRDPATPDSTTGVTVVGVRDVAFVSAGYAHTCAVLHDGRTWCWGYDTDSVRQLSNSSDVDGFIGTTTLAAGDGHTCAGTIDGHVRCWGANRSGQLGDGTTKTRSGPVDVDGLTGAVTVVAKDRRTCALLRDGTVWCWGAWQCNVNTQILSAPVQVAGIGDAVAVEVGFALGSNGSLWSWQQLCANGGAPPPVQVQGVESAVSVSSAGGHTCATLRDGTVWCWGANGYCQLGNGTCDGSSTVPVQAIAISDAVSVLAGSNHTCALLRDGTIWCWGSLLGSDGSSTTVGTPVPAKVQGIESATALSGGASHDCARLANGEIRCWGQNTSGELGDGTATARPIPVVMRGVENAILVAAGTRHTCVLHSDSRLRCWGDSSHGELGNRRLGPLFSPALVTDVPPGFDMGPTSPQTQPYDIFEQCPGFVEGAIPVVTTTRFYGAFKVTVMPEGKLLCLQRCGAAPGPSVVRVGSTVAIYGYPSPFPSYGMESTSAVSPDGSWSDWGGWLGRVTTAFPAALGRPEVSATCDFMLWHEQYSGMARELVQTNEGEFFGVDCLTGNMNVHVGCQAAYHPDRCLVAALRVSSPDSDDPNFCPTSP